MVIPKMIPSDERVFVGGGVIPLINLCKGLVANQNEVTIVAGSSRQGCSILSNSKFPWAEICPIEIKSSPTSVKYGAEFLAKSMFQIVRRYRDGKFDIIHGHSGYAPYASIPVVTRRLLKVPAIHTLYCPIVDKIDASYKTPILNAKVTKELLKHLDKLVVISKNVKVSVQKIGISPEKIVVLPPAIDTSCFNPSALELQTRKELGVEENEPLILFVGNLKKNKGIDVLIRAMANVVRAHNSAKLIVTLELKHKGFEDRWVEIESEARKLGIFTNIIRLGIIKNMPNVMAASDLLVAPWLNTGGPSDYPITILEAMAVGTPVVATTVGGIPEIFATGNNGILVTPRNHEELSSSILSLLNNRELRMIMGQNGSQFVAQHFSIIHVTKMMEQVYTKVLDGEQ